MTIASTTPVVVHNTITLPYRWMDQKVSLRAAAAVDRGELLENDIYMQIQKSAAERGLQIFVGRVVSETGEDEKDPKVLINTHSIRLEGCTGRSAGKSVRLYVNECPSYLLYSGAIVGAIGRLVGADEFHAEQLFTRPSPAPVVVKSVQTTPLVVISACGPFSPDNMLLFDSISELELKVRSDSPDVVILTGPFLDVNHPLVAAGTVCDAFGRPVSFDEIYKEEIFPKLARLARACEVAKSQLFIVPALSEARFDFPLPQPPLNTSALFSGIAPSIQFVSNPATIEIGDYKLLVSSTDALAALNANVLFKQGDGPGRVDACLAHLLDAKTLFPVSPSGVRINPELSHLLTNAPTDIIVFPSAGRRFAKLVESTLFVNSGTDAFATITLPQRNNPNVTCSAEISKLS